MSRSIPTPARRNWLAILATGIGFALVQLDVSIVNVALVSIGADLRTGIAGLQWVVDAYAVAFAALLLSAGSLGDRVGARKALIAGFALFGAASLGCGLAPDAPTLIIARVAQGAAAALLVPCSLALLNHASQRDTAARARAIGWWTAAGSVSLSAGPVLGGMLVSTLGWRSIFLINLPIAATGIWLARRFLAESTPRPAGFDPAGQVLGTLALAALIGAVIEAGSATGAGALPFAGLAIAAVAGAAFLLAEARVRQPMLPLGFFRHPSFGLAILVGFLINFTLYGVIFALGLYLQQVRGWSPVDSGIAFMPFAVTLLASNLAAGWIVGRIGTRAPMAAGLAIGAVGYWLLCRLDGTTPYVSMLPGLVAIPLGIGLAVPAMTTSLLATVPRARGGIASGVLNAVRQTGGAIGVALFGSFMAASQMRGVDMALTISATVLAAAAIAVGYCRKLQMSEIVTR